MLELMNTPWKITNELMRWIVWPRARVTFALAGISWGRGWRLHGVPIIQKHRQSKMQFGSGFCLRSALRSNPLGPTHPVILCTWKAGATLQIGDNFGMTGGSIVAAEQISIGNRVNVGANSTVIDTDFHPLDVVGRRQRPQEGKAMPIIIEDDVFIGMNCLILKGVVIGCGSVIGAGSVVTRDVPPGVIVAGNPSQIIRQA